MDRPLVPHPECSGGELVRPDVDEVDHDGSAARVLGVVRSEEVEPCDRAAIDRQSTSRPMGHRHRLPQVHLLTDRLDRRAEVHALEGFAFRGVELPVDVIEG